MAKTVTAMLVGELVADGKLALDAPAPVPEWHRPGDPRGAITLRMLLQMRSGLRHTEIGDPIQRSDTHQMLFVGRTGEDRKSTRLNSSHSCAYSMPYSAIKQTTSNRQ